MNSVRLEHEPPDVKDRKSLLLSPVPFEESAAAAVLSLGRSFFRHQRVLLLLLEDVI